jgi:hypothetical protein
MNAKTTTYISTILNFFNNASNLIPLDESMILTSKKKKVLGIKIPLGSVSSFLQ